MCMAHILGLGKLEPRTGLLIEFSISYLASLLFFIVTYGKGAGCSTFYAQA